MTNIKSNFVQRVKQYLSESAKLQRKLGMRVSPALMFGQMRKLPFHIRFACWWIRIWGGTMDLKFEDLRKK